MYSPRLSAMMIRPPATFLCILLIVLIPTVPVQAATYYVATDGDDRHGGLTLRDPLRTIRRAAEMVKPGDTIEIRSGTYEGALIKNPGTESAWITMRPHKGERVIVTAANPGRPTIYFYHRTCDSNNPGNRPCQALYWALEGLEIRGSGAGGSEDYVVKIDTPRVKLIRNNLWGSAADIIKLVHTADDVEIIRNEIHHPNAKAGANAQGVDIVGADRTRVAYNHVHDIPSSGIYAKGNARNAVFENNRVENIFMHGIMLGQSTDSHILRDGKYETYGGIIRNNIIRNTGWSCVATASSYNVRIYNNNCYNTGIQKHGSVLISNESKVGQAGKNIEIKNNIIYGSPDRPMIRITSNALTDSSTLRIDHNIYWTDRGAGSVVFTWGDLGLEKVSFTRWKVRTKQDENSMVADPRYTNTRDLVPTIDSPAVGAGTITDIVATDFTGAGRSRPGRMDIGAYDLGRGRP
jgi:hypothetical protein